MTAAAAAAVACCAGFLTDIFGMSVMVLNPVPDSLPNTVLQHPDSRGGWALFSSWFPSPGGGASPHPSSLETPTDFASWAPLNLPPSTHESDLQGGRNVSVR